MSDKEHSGAACGVERLRHAATCVRTVAGEGVTLARLALSEKVKDGTLRADMNTAIRVAAKRGFEGEEAVAVACAILMQEQLASFERYTTDRASDIDKAADRLRVAEIITP